MNRTARVDDVMVAKLGVHPATCPPSASIQKASIADMTLGRGGGLNFSL